LRRWSVGEARLAVLFSALSTLWSLTPHGARCSLAQLLGQAYASARHRALLAEGAAGRYRQRASYVVPFTGCWYVLRGGLTPKDSHAWALPHQRYAYDFVVVRGGRTHRGSGLRLEDYYAYGRPALAPARGAVVEVRDGCPDNPPGRLLVRAVRDMRGNYVIIRHAYGEYSLLAHLRCSSVRVRVGDAVAEGQVVAECGNSGLSSEPHLHFQVQNSRDFYACVSLPVKVTYMAGGEVRTGYLRRGMTVCSPYMRTK